MCTAIDIVNAMEYDIDELDKKYTEDSVSGGVFANNIDLGLAAGDTSQDTMLAKMIAEEEMRPAVRAGPNVAEVKQFKQDYDRYTPEIRDEIFERQHDRADRFRAEQMEHHEREHAARLQRDLDRERSMLAAEKRERERDREKEHERERARSLDRTYVTRLPKIYVNDYSPLYLDKDRLIRWGLDLLPYGYSAYEEPLKKFITQRIMDRLDEAEIERRIRRYIADLDIKKPRAAPRKSPVRRSKVARKSKTVRKSKKSRKSKK